MPTRLMLLVPPELSSKEYLYIYTQAQHLYILYKHSNLNSHPPVFLFQAINYLFLLLLYLIILFGFLGQALALLLNYTQVDDTIA